MDDTNARHCRLSRLSASTDTLPATDSERKTATDVGIPFTHAIMTLNSFCTRDFFLLLLKETQEFEAIEKSPICTDCCGPHKGRWIDENTDRVSARYSSSSMPLRSWLDSSEELLVFPTVNTTGSISLLTMMSRSPLHLQHAQHGCNSFASPLGSQMPVLLAGAARPLEA